MTIGEKILELRKKNGLNQEDLAEKVNVTRQTISNWESDSTVPDFYQAIELSKAFNIDINELADNKVEKKDEMASKKDNELFQQILLELKKEINPVSYESWFKDLELIEVKDNKIIIEASYYLIKNILDKYEIYKALIMKKSSELYNKKISEVVFVVKGELNENK